MNKIFYRINHIDTKQGVWYDFDGNFTGLIHDKFKFCKNHELRMDFDPEVVGYMSATETLDELLAWFTEEDIQALQNHNYFIHQYIADDYKWYERFGHYLIKQDTSKVGQVITITQK